MPSPFVEKGNRPPKNIGTATVPPTCEARGSKISYHYNLPIIQQLGAKRETNQGIAQGIAQIYRLLFQSSLIFHKPIPL
jgi:hypothetical protein